MVGWISPLQLRCSPASPAPLLGDGGLAACCVLLPFRTPGMSDPLVPLNEELLEGVEDDAEHFLHPGGQEEAEEGTPDERLAAALLRVPPWQRQVSGRGLVSAPPGWLAGWLAGWLGLTAMHADWLRSESVAGEARERERESVCE